MTENKLISPMLDNFDVGGPISDHNGVQCFPAMRKDSDERYIVKSVSIPASQRQLDALLLTGAYPDAASALTYFKEQADETIEELETLQRLSQLEGFLPYEQWQVVPREDSIGFDVYMLGTYKRSLRKHLQRETITHLMAVNLGLDLCAALAVCRRCGYMYVDLKPSNVYVLGGREFRIGDLGFLRLDALKYSTIPDKYRSAYSAPELQDPFSPVSPNIDIYAAGLILYQAYNGGELPFTSETPPNERFDAPMYADYEMSEIILKACDPDPNNRWQDPIEMGQALVSYMQRNGANDTPIITAVPAAPAEEASSEIVNEIEQFLVEDDIDLSDIDLSDIPEIEGYDQVSFIPEEETAAEDASPEEEAVDEAPLPEEISEDVQDTDAALLDNLSFLQDAPEDETAPENNIADVDYGEVSDELSEILSQADELVAHPVPEPVVAPDAPELVIPDMISDADDSLQEEIIEEEPETAEESESVENTPPEADLPGEADAPEPAFDAPAEEDADVVAAIAEAMQEDTDIDASQEDTAEGEDAPAGKSSSHILRNIIIFLLLAIVAVAGFLYYRFIYLQPVYSIMVDGDESSMVVLVDSDAEEALLSVICSDAHGNQLSAPVVNGVATFANLAPDTGYNVKVVMDGFHKLTGETAVSYSTPAQTNIVQFSAVTGAEDGSVILSFTLEGPDTGMWSVNYSAADEAEKSADFPMSTHMLTLTGLTVGKEYSFTLIPGEKMYITGSNQTSFVASTLVYAKDVNIVSCVDGKLTAVWTAPEETEVSSWTVRCYNDSGYNETIITSETTAVFEGIDPAVDHTIEVIAAGMSVSQRAYMDADAITISNFQASPTNSGCLDLTWEASAAPQGGWVVLYSIDGLDANGTVSSSSNSAQVKPMIPGTTYHFTLQQANGDAVLTAPLSFQIPEAQDFSGYGVTRNTIDFEPCRRPGDNWKASDVSASDYVSTFSVGDSISLVGHLEGSKSVSDDIILTLFVFRDQDGNIVTHSFQERSWRNMWDQKYGAFDVPQVPAKAGKYSLSVYFNGKLVTVESITIQ